MPRRAMPAQAPNPEQRRLPFRPSEMAWDAVWGTYDELVAGDARYALEARRFYPSILSPQRIYVYDPATNHYELVRQS